MRPSIIVAVNLLVFILVVPLLSAAGAAEYAVGPDSLMLEIRETAVVDSGFLYLYGNPIQPPYTFQIAGDSLYAELYINDYIAYSIDRRPTAPDSLSPCGRLAREISDTLSIIRRMPVSTSMDRTETVAEMYRRHPECADSVEVVGPGRLALFRRSADGQFYQETVITEPPRPIENLTAYDIVKQRTGVLMERLRKGYTAFFWKGLGGYYPASPNSGLQAWLDERPDRVKDLLSEPERLRRRRR